MDADTGYGNAINVKRTVSEYARLGFAGVMIEDQVAPKRCGHTKGKSVVSREEAVSRIQAAVDARNEGADIFILARTDAREGLGLEEAIERCKLFHDLGADMTFLEAPQTIEEMKEYCRAVPGFKMANMVEHGKTPILPQSELEAMGYTVAAYPITVLSAAMKAMESVLSKLKRSGDYEADIMNFEDVKEIVGFNRYYKEEEKYKTS